MERLDRPYCDVCGGIVSDAHVEASQPHGKDADDEEDAALICDVCVRTRRVFPEGAVTPADERAGIASRFRCPHCDRRLKTRTIKVRTEVDCPRCKGKLSLLPDGSVEAGLPSWPRPPGKDGKGGEGEGTDGDQGSPGEDAADAAGSEAARASGSAAERAERAADRAADKAADRAAEDRAARARAEERGPGGDLPSDLAELLATRAAFDARAASDSTETITGPARRAAENEEWQRSVSRGATATSGRRISASASGSGSSDRVPVPSGEKVLTVSSSEWPPAPTFASHASAEAPAAPTAPVPAPAAPAPASTRTPAPVSASAARSEPAARSERRAPIVASISPATRTAPASPAAPPAASPPGERKPLPEPRKPQALPARAPWIRVAIAAVLVLGGVGGAFLVRNAHGVPGPVAALGDRVGKGFQHLEARLK